jgi:hypothetical protein
MTLNPSRKSNDKQWSVVNRAKIQQLLIHLQDLVDSNFETIRHLQPLERRVGYLLGSSFALWRACFLVEHAEESDFLASAQKFVAKVLSDNTITFNDDKNAWSCWWYLEIARSNLYRAVELEAVGFGDLQWTTDQTRTTKLGELALLDSGEGYRRGMWDRLYEILESTTLLFSDQLSEQSYRKTYT